MCLVLQRVKALLLEAYGFDKHVTDKFDAVHKGFGIDAHAFHRKLTPVDFYAVLDRCLELFCPRAFFLNAFERFASCEDANLFDGWIECA